LGALALLLSAACTDAPSAPAYPVASLAKKPPPPPVCQVLTANELMITSVSVVDDPLRSTWATSPTVDPRAASWTFGRLMQKIAGPNDPQSMVRNLFDTWTVDQTVNGQIVTARPKMATKVINPWLAASGGGLLDLKKAPFLLSAIVNRMDLQDLSKQSAGEGRLTFNFLTSVTNGVSLPATVIFEFNLPAADQAAFNQWAADWHALGALTLGSAAYNDALGKIVDRFTATGNLLRFRTNEVAFDPATDNDFAAVEQFREFRVNAAGALFDMVPVALTPANAVDGTTALADFINQNEAAILAGTHTVPLTFGGAPFQGGAVFGPPNQQGATGPMGFWKAPGILNNDARERFSVNTCNGCHNLAETGTDAVHVFRPKPRSNKSAAAAGLSGFLTGITVQDPVSGAARAFGDLSRRNARLTAMVCP
jgi:hypothetical protein